MAAEEDGRARLSESAICRIARVDRNRRRAWADHELVRKRGRKGYEALDVAELAAFRALVAELDFDRARVAWLAVRRRFRDRLLVGAPLLIVLDEGRSEALLPADPQELYDFLVRAGSFEAVDVSATVATALGGFRKAWRAKSGEYKSAESAKNVQQMRKKSTK